MSSQDRDLGIGDIPHVAQSSDADEIYAAGELAGDADLVEPGSDTEENGK